MPGKAWGLPAGHSCPWAHYLESLEGAQAICKGCYAQAGAYRWTNVQAAQETRFAWARKAIKTGEFERVMIAALRKQEYFRIHDSGDFFNVAYVESWERVCRALPNVRFWAPTRSYRDHRMLEALRRLAALPNVTIRPSALHFGARAPRIKGLASGSTAGNRRTTVQCPAKMQDGKCGNCRACWDRPRAAVSYAVHGRTAVKIVTLGWKEVK